MYGKMFGSNCTSYRSGYGSYPPSPTQTPPKEGCLMIIAYTILSWITWVVSSLVLSSNKPEGCIASVGVIALAWGFVIYLQKKNKT